MTRLIPFKLITAAFLCLFLQYAETTAQETPDRQILIGNQQLLRQVEERLNVKFYYRAGWLERIKLHKPETYNNKQVALAEIFYGTPLNYHIYQNNQVIITMAERLDKSTQMAGIAKPAEPEDMKKETVSQNKATREIHVIGRPGNPGNEVPLAGQVTEYYTGQPLEGVEVFVDDGKYGVVTNVNGRYRLDLPNGYHVVQYRYLGFKNTQRHIKIYSAGKMNIRMEQKPLNIEQVNVTARRNREEREIAGFEKLEMKELKELPSFMGEPDIIKQSLLMPGIQSAGEADMSFSVRGGKGDQNLILIDGMHTYSHSHFFGFFPGINPGTIEDANLYKAGIPVQYGNRISSVYDISTEEGHNEKFKVDGGFSLVNGNLMASGPLIKDKLTVMASGRMTYADWLLKNLKKIDQLEYSQAGFYDYQLKMNYQMSPKSSLAVLFYNSHDDFTLKKDTSYAFRNTLGSINWQYKLDETTTIKTIAGFSIYDSNMDNIASEEEASHKNQTISDMKLSSFVEYGIGEEHRITGGIDLVYHNIEPWSLSKGHSNSLVIPQKLNNQKALESSLFVGDQFNLSSRLKINAGLRYTMYSLLGDYTGYKYQDGLATVDRIYDTVRYANNELVYFNSGLEANLSGSYQLMKNHHLNFGFNRNRQYIHLLTNSQGVTPTDSWQLASENIPPQIGNQFSAGYNVDFKRNMYMASVDLYYKTIRNYKDFINGSQFELNPHPETELVNAEGKSYGAEFMFRKNRGRISGWISYTYSRSLIRSQSDVASKNINEGQYYPASYDKPHNLSVVLNMKPTRRLTLSNVVNFSTGAPITLPVAKIAFENSYSVIYSDRNEFRIPNYFRWDVSVTYKGSLKRDKLISGSWILSVYNLTGRMNAYSIYYKTGQENIQGYKLSIFGRPIPTITYKFNF